MPEKAGRWERWAGALQQVDETPRTGRIVQVVGLGIEALGPDAEVGEIVMLHPRSGAPILAEVVGFRNDRLLLMPLGEMEGVGPGARVTTWGRRLQVPVGYKMLGRVVDSFGAPIDGGPPIAAEARRDVNAPSPHPMRRRRIDSVLPLGIRSIDSLITCGKGQRLGIFAGSGVGKSTLMGMIARGADSALNVIGLIGERGREVREFLERDLGEEGLKRSVVVVATADQPALVRVRAAFLTTAIAEFFRDEGEDVLLMMDSVTRFAFAAREVGLTAGEPPATKGYPPSVFSLLPKLVERAGPGERGTITALYTVLVEGDDMADPVADSLRSLLDGHVVLSRALAEKGSFPAVDPLASVSRSMLDVVDEEHLSSATAVRSLLAAYRDSEDLIQIGAYAKGSNPRVDRAIELMPQLTAFLEQGVNEMSEWASVQETLKRLGQLARLDAAAEAGQ